MNYRPNAVARGPSKQKTTTVGVIIPDISKYLLLTTSKRGFEDITATMYKYHSIISNSDNDPEKEKEIFNNLLSKQVDGIIFPWWYNYRRNERIDKSIICLPVVVVSGTNGQGIHIPSVIIGFYYKLQKKLRES